MGRDCRCNCREFAKSGDNLPASQAPQGLLGAATSYSLCWEFEGMTHFKGLWKAQTGLFRRAVSYKRRQRAGCPLGEYLYAAFTADRS